MHRHIDDTSNRKGFIRYEKLISASSPAGAKLAT
jgi:hypothetical protein